MTEVRYQISHWTDSQKKALIEAAPGIARIKMGDDQVVVSSDKFAELFTRMEQNLVSAQVQERVGSQAENNKNL